MGAVTVVINRRNPLGGTAAHCLATVTWSNSYASGGDTYVNSQFGLTNVNEIIAGGAAGAAGVGYLVVPDIANKKLKLDGGAASGVGLAQTSGDQSGTTAQILVFGDEPYI